MRVYVNTHKPSPCALPGQLSGRRTRRLNVTALGYLAVGQRVALGKVPVALWSRGGAEGEETPPRRCHHLPPNPRTFPKFYFHLISGAGSSALEEGAPGLLPWVPGSAPAHLPHEDGGNSGRPGTAGGWGWVCSLGPGASAEAKPGLRTTRTWPQKPDTSTAQTRRQPLLSPRRTDTKVQG